MSSISMSDAGGVGGRAATVTSEIVRRLRDLGRRLAERFGKRDRQKGAVSAMAQEIGEMRRKIRDDLARRRARRRLRLLAGKSNQG